MKKHQGLYDPAYDHDACGVGIVANLNGRRSHEIIRHAVEVLINLEHRGACGCDPHTGDGAGILFQIPDAFFQRHCRPMGISLPDPGRYGVGMVFLPRETEHHRWCEQVVEKCVRDVGQEFLGWRDVPADFTQCGDLAAQVAPLIRQFFIGAGPETATQDQFERKLYVIRKVIENAVDAGLAAEVRDDFYISSLSSKTVVYKGLLRADQIDSFYRDLSDDSMVSALALVHSRYSTNTLGSWRLAHPYPRQPELDAGAGGVVFVVALRRRHGQAEPDHPRGGQRHGGLRQRPGVAGVHRAVVAPRLDDDDSRGLGKPRDHVGREKGVLRLPRLPDGAVGRSGAHRRL